jgi:hypothetical protein
VHRIQRICEKQSCQISGMFSEIATFKLQVPAGHQNIAGFLKFSTFLSDL